MKKIKILFLFLFLLFSNLISAQISVEQIELTETISNKFVSKIPRVISELEKNRFIVNKINAHILDRFLIESFNQSELEEFRWDGVEFNYEIKENILVINYSGDYLGAYPNYVEEELFFDLNTGEQLSNSDIPFHALFSLHGYLDFMNQFWLKEARQAFIEAVECADDEPLCSYYDIAYYSVTGNKINISLSDDCYARVSRACNPSVKLILPLDSIETYLSDQGEKIISADSYTSKKGVDKFLYNRSQTKTLPNNTYLFGKIDGKYPFSMALNFEEDSDQISGYYYYDSKLDKLQLEGLKNNASTIVLRESLNNLITGTFKMNLSKTYIRDGFYIYDPNGESTYLTGTWSNPEGTKNFNIEFTEVKMNQINN